MQSLQSILILSLIHHLNAANFGPTVQATKGAVWPKPQHQQQFDTFFAINPSLFTFEISPNIGCPNLVNNALARYKTILEQAAPITKDEGGFNLLDGYLGNLTSLTVETSCDDDAIRPSLEDDETYNLVIAAEQQTLSAGSIWGLLHGLETFSQLVYKMGSSLVINATNITDFPQYPHRGFLLDTARHFLPLDIIYTMLDAMAYNKMNVFHWHLTDDESFPYQSILYPEMSALGAYSSSRVYTQDNIRDIIEYARVRGIRLLVEFDMPGHTLSWGASHPELLSPCYDQDGRRLDSKGPLNPILTSTYEFVYSFIDEVLRVFPDASLHLGGDEVDFTCWQSDSAVTTFMAAHNIETYPALQSYFMDKIVRYVTSRNITPIVWEDAFTNGVVLDDTPAIVHAWRIENFGTILKNVTDAHKYALTSTCWYLDTFQISNDWNLFYRCEPLYFLETEEQRKMVLGGEACMWTEVANQFNIVSRVWPRASAVAERLWSTLSDIDTEAQMARARIEEHTCRMNSRGIQAQPPNGPSICL